MCHVWGVGGDEEMTNMGWARIISLVTTFTANNYLQIMEKVPVFGPSHSPGVCRSVTRSGTLKIVLGLKGKVLAGSDVHSVLVCGTLPVVAWPSNILSTNSGRLLCLFTHLSP